MSKNNLELQRDKNQFTMWRVFDAPIDKVWEACTTPELIPKWWGPRNTTTIVDKMDFKVGGVWRYISQGADGSEVGFNGVYKEIDKPNRLVYTFEFEPVPGHISIDHITLEQLPDGKTKITDVTTFDSVEALDGMIGSGMEQGATETWDRLEELTAEL